MSDNRYNGWTNRETWLINIHFNPECVADVDAAEAYIEDWYEGLDALTKDFVDVGCINWDELRKNQDDYKSEGSED